LLKTLEGLRPEVVPERVEDFLAWLGGPTWIAVEGRDRARTRAIATLVHGNEPSGVHAVHRWLRSGVKPAVDTLFFIGAVSAALAPPGFAHRMLPGEADLNRRFRPPFEGPEGALAREILDRLYAAAPEALVDLHDNSGHNPAYGVGLDADPALLSLTSFFANRFVHTRIELGALTEATHEDFPSVTIECGRAGDPGAREIASEGLQRLLEADSVLQRSVGDAMDVLVDPLRVSLRPGGSLAFGDEPRGDVDLTVQNDIDRHNFESLPTGTAIGWVRAQGMPLEARDPHGHDLAETLFEVRDGLLRTRRPIVPIMMTTDARAAIDDCLFYSVRRRSELEDGAE
jgi:hypothetical protein